MSTTLFKRAAATGAALVAIASAAAMSLPSAGAATSRPPVSPSVNVAQAHKQADYWCHYGYRWRWCPPYPRPYPCLPSWCRPSPRPPWPPYRSPGPEVTVGHHHNGGSRHGH